MTGAQDIETGRKADQVGRFEREVKETVHLLRRQAMEIIIWRLIALSHELAGKKVGILKGVEIHSLKLLLQLSHDRTGAEGLFTGFTFAGTTFIEFIPAAAGARIISADFHTAPSIKATWFPGVCLPVTEAFLKDVAGKIVAAVQPSVIYQLQFLPYTLRSTSQTPHL